MGGAAALIQAALVICAEVFSMANMGGRAKVGLQLPVWKIINT